MKVVGACPACGSQSLFLGAGGYITCGRLECPQPDSVTDLLNQTKAAEAGRTR